ncbi:hypothetical protein INR49_008630 [Caranx melampygus]|nr:hypothetical protein INR49_008630 [Caranx melampygus]
MQICPQPPQRDAECRGQRRPASSSVWRSAVNSHPRCATDVSELREIPDNQEVFAHAHTDQSLIVELVEYQGQVADEDSARYHFEDIAGSNKALEPGAYEVTSVVALPKSDLSLLECSSAWMLTGTQCVSKFNEEARNTVTLHLGVFRLPQFSTDILITFNDPQSISPDSSSAAAVGGHKMPWTVQDFQRLLQTLTLHDPGLHKHHRPSCWHSHDERHPDDLRYRTQDFRPCSSQ